MYDIFHLEKRINEVVSHAGDSRKANWRKRGVNNPYQKPGIILAGNEDDSKN
jgi:hypothetical protein